MSLGALLFGASLAFVGALFGVQLWMARQTQAAVGREAPSLPPEVGTEGDSLLFFHSPTCAPCRVMKPAVEAARATDPRVRLVDVTSHFELARAYGVMATPTTVLVRDGKVQRAQAGALSASVLQEWLAAL